MGDASMDRSKDSKIAFMRYRNDGSLHNPVSSLRLRRSSTSGRIFLDKPVKKCKKFQKLVEYCAFQETFFRNGYFINYKTTYESNKSYI